MSKEIKRFLDGETIPDNAIYLYSDTELDKANSRIERWMSDGPLGLWHTLHEKRITPRRAVHFYEVVNGEASKCGVI